MLPTSFWTTSPTFWYWSQWLLRIGGSIALLVLGLVVAQQMTVQLRRLLARMWQRDNVAGSPLGVMLDSLPGARGSGLFSTVVYWVVFFFFISLAGEMLGLTVFTNIVSMFLRALPVLLSALIILFLGVMVAGVLERTVKQQLKRVAPQQAVLVGSLTSYVTLALFMLIALSEMGIASEFIIILFGGGVLACALAIGLAVGLGAKDIMAEMLRGMIKEEQQRRGQR